MSTPIPPKIEFPKPILPTPDDSDHACKTFQYAVKIVCGRTSALPAANKEIVAPGLYFTAINIHNPATCKSVTFRWRVVIANRINEPIGLISTQRKITLRPEQSIEIDTPDILQAAQLRFGKGFVIIESPCELDIVAVYTTSHEQVPPQSPGSIVAFHTERVPARRVDACRENLDVDLSTGVADWTIVSAVKLSPPGAPLLTTPRPAAIVPQNAYHPVWGSQPGADWVSVNSIANVPNLNLPGLVPGFYTFQTCFSLCSGFESASINMTMYNDDEVEIRLNDTLVGQFPRNLGNIPPTPVTPVSITQGFLPGINCLSVVIQNDDNHVPANPVGLNLKARLLSARGACPDCGCGCGDEKLKYPRPRRFDGPDPNVDPVNPDRVK